MDGTMQLRDDNSRGKKRPVEQRKLSKHYLNFISASQRFYCGYIQQLLSQYNGISELEEVARRFDIEGKLGFTTSRQYFGILR